MSAYTKTQLLELIKTIPYFSKHPINTLSVDFTLLPSHTNNSYKVTFTENISEEYLLKISKISTNKFVNRKNEQQNTTIAFELGLTSEPLWFGEDSLQHISVSRYLKNCRNIDPIDLHDAKQLTLLADSLHKLQNSQKPFQGDFSNPRIITKQIKTYFDQCIPVKQKSLLKQVLKAEAILSSLNLNKSKKEQPVPAHIDLMTDNILLQQSKDTKIWLIDWEYSAMASPYWDIASLCNANTFSLHETNQLVSKVRGHCDDEDIDLLQKYQCIEKTLVKCWCAAFVADIKKP